MVRILYLVHNLGDPAVARRVRMLQLGGAELTVAGFAREGADFSALPDPILLGTTFDARFAQRAWSVISARNSIASRLRSVPAPDVIVARNLEMLALANRLRQRWLPAVPMVYECLDIHRLMLRGDPFGGLLRRVERSLGRRASLLVTSSPAFLREYFDRYRQLPAPRLLVENKILAEARERGRNPVTATDDVSPLRIGWFGALRCSRSLAALGAFSRQMQGKVEVVLRGRPALTEFEDFHATVAGEPHLRFEGAYGAAELGAIYSEVHFSWAIDYFEEGQNSRWLLPNRIYEGCFHGAIPIALAGTETASFINRLGIGIVLENTEPETLARAIGSIGPQQLRSLADKVARCSAAHFAHDQSDCRALVEKLRQLTEMPAPELVAAA